METGLIGIGEQYLCFQPDNPIVIYCKYTTVIWGGGGGGYFGAPVLTGEGMWVRTGVCCSLFTVQYSNM